MQDEEMHTVEALSANEHTEFKKSSLSKAVILTGLGVGLSLVAVFLAVNGRGNASLAREYMESMQKQVAVMEDALSRADVKIDELNQMDMRHANQIRSISEQVQNELNKVSVTLNETNTKVSRQGEALEKLLKHFTRKTSPELLLVNNEHIYEIQTGDTFGKIAQRCGRSIDAIRTANPTVNPRKLQVGQQIKIPSE
ncbi:MAG: hypothetical protein A2Y14_05060 [Verrucomicrobia bacterium GWF2_51_19]|nr:MAG: hypothetical protein A2Y14_05060 [Verrucomicrobia bacterium GWF2_51_19]HCJ11740.1 hypothetical protein [Opitutae bacterium]